MRTPFLVGVLAIAACATPPLFEPREWTATATGRPGHEQARASVRAVVGPGAATAAAINLAGGTPGATHPWHIHSGTCASGGPIVGDPASYPPLRPGSGGSAAATAALRVALMPDGEYHVNVHLSPTELGTIIACGDLS